MAQSGYTPISIYYSATATNVPLAANLTSGELGINIADGKLYYKDNAGTVQVLASKAGNINVSSISFGSTGLTPSTATQGAVTVAGTLITSNGGTGLSSYTAGDLPYYASGTALSKLGIGTNGYILQSTGSAPTWVAASSVVGGAGGSNTQVQYNSSGSLAGSANMVFDGSTLTTLNSAYTGTLTGGTGVVNLGSGQFYKDASGNVGINNNSPTTKLDVIGSSTNGSGIVNTVRLQNNGTAIGDGTKILFTNGNQTDGAGIASTGVSTNSSDLRFYTGGSNERMRINATGDVGIGVTAAEFDGTALQVGTTSAFYSPAPTYTNLISNAAEESGVTYYMTTGSATLYSQNRGNGIHSWFTAPSGTANAVATFTERMRLDNSGNLLVGTTTSPSGIGQINAPAGLTGTPTFSAYQNSAQTLTSGVLTKITYDTEEYDTNSNFASSRFTPTIAGYYLINATMQASLLFTSGNMIIFKNGSAFMWGFATGGVAGTTGTFIVSGQVYLNGSTDYVEIYGSMANGQALNTGVATRFQGIMVRGE